MSADQHDDLYDVAVVGAGPAGSAAALGALTQDPTARVLLLDRADFPRDKVCGDGIAPHCVDVLRTLGAEDVVDGWTPLTRLDLATDRAVVNGTMARPVYVIPREVFDARLVEHAVARGAELRRHRVRTVEVGSDRVVLDAGTDHSVAARVVVAADGVHSVVRQAAGAGRTTRRAIAIRGYVPTPPGRRALQVIRYGARHQPSYAWSFDRGDGLANVGYGELLADGQRESSKQQLVEELERLLPGSVEGASAFRGHHLPLSGFRWDQPDGRLLLAGDAAGLINPMTGEGIYYALATGAIAGRTALTHPDEAGARHRSAVRRLLGRHLQHTWAASRLTRSTVMIEAGIHASSRSAAVFDDIVEIGLGNGRITPRVALGLAGHLAGNLAGGLTHRAKG